MGRPNDTMRQAKGTTAIAAISFPNSPTGSSAERKAWRAATDPWSCEIVLGLGPS
jgi:hypothetical protein